MIDSLGKSMEALESKLKPKKKFAFSNKNKKIDKDPATTFNDSVIGSLNEAMPAVVAIENTPGTSSSGNMVDFLPPGAYVVSNRTNDSHILLDATHFQQHVLNQCHDQSVRVQLFIKNNSNCTIIV